MMIVFAESPLHDATFSAALLPAAGIVLALVGVGALIVLASRRALPQPQSRNWLSRLIYLGFVASVVALAATSFVSILKFGHMGGYALMAHTSAAGAFVFLLLGVAAFYLPTSRAAATEHRWWLATASAWVLVLSGVVVAATMFASMLPLLGTEDLLEAVRWHRWAGLVVTAAAIIHAFTLLCVRRGWR